MTQLRQRVLVLLAITAACIILGVYLLSSRLLLKSYAVLERQSTMRDLGRVENAFQQIVSDLHAKSFDWANWDDTYRFMHNHNRTYIDSNLTDASLQGMHLDIILYIDVHKTLFHTKSIRRLKEWPAPVPQQILAELPFHSLQDRRIQDGTIQSGPDLALSGELNGIISLSGHPLFISVRPIRNSSNGGAPRGWLIFGRYFDQELIRKLAERTRLDVQFQRLDAIDLPAYEHQIAGTISAAAPYRIIPRTEQTMAGFALIRDVTGQPLLLVQLTARRDIYLRGVASVSELMRLIVFAAVVFSAVILFVLEHFVLSRLAQMSRQVAEIGDLSGPLPRVTVTGNDELAYLAGKINTMVAALEDNTTRLRHNEEELRQYSTGLEQAVAERTRELREANSVLENALDGIARLNVDGSFVSVNAAYAAMIGLNPDMFVGRHWTAHVYPADLALLQDAFAAAEVQGKIETEARGQREDGSIFNMQLVLIPVADAGGRPDGYYCFLKDVTERKRLEAKIVHQAFHDALTGLPNRGFFLQSLRQAQARAQREQTLCTVIFIDLDNFKLVNDSLGHEAGDSLLITVAQRLTECVRPGDMVARLGGDEFTILLENLNSTDEATAVAERILSSLRVPIKLPQREVFASASIGISCLGSTTQDPETLMRDADIAMYQAKAGGKSAYAFFDPEMNASVVERLEIETGLRHALERNEFHVQYQPLIDLASGRLVGTEALLRWNHPTHGSITPTRFIPIAEATGLIVPIGYWVLEEACRQTKAWQEQYPTDPPLTVSVNLSTMQLQRDDVVERVAAALAASGLAPATLKLEITESGLMGNIETAVMRLKSLKTLGIKLAIDDFGTGYSSMSYLTNLPVDTVKIDRAFISRLSDHEETANIVNAMIMMSRTLQLDVTAEGIETEEQVIHLQGLGCQIGQGYYFARPATTVQMQTHLTAKANSFTRPPGAADQNLIEGLLSELSDTGRKAA